MVILQQLNIFKICIFAVPASLVLFLFSIKYYIIKFYKSQKKNLMFNTGDGQKNQTSDEFLRDAFQERFLDQPDARHA